LEREKRLLKREKKATTAQTLTHRKQQKLLIGSSLLCEKSPLKNSLRGENKVYFRGIHSRVTSRKKENHRLSQLPVKTKKIRTVSVVEKETQGIHSEEGDIIRPREEKDLRQKKGEDMFPKDNHQHKTSWKKKERRGKAGRRHVSRNVNLEKKRSIIKISRDRKGVT